jgi:hypothetical protein
MKAPGEFYKHHFKVDENGRPLPMFKINIGEGKHREILNYDHSAFVYPFLKKIDAWIEQQLNQINQCMTQAEADALIKESEQLNKHAHMLVGQAYYLDTADRNSWPTIKQVILGMPSGRSLTPSIETLKYYVKAVDIEAYATRVNQKTRHHDEFSP